ncbi:MAG: hypothetical protein ACLPKB_02140 [Xanthobacteraceae bacterium]
MGDAPELLLFSNPEAFMAVVNNHDETERAQVLSTLDDMVTCEVLRHGIFNDQRGLPHLIKFYDEVFMQAPVDRRRQIYRHVAMIVPQLGGWTVGAFTPFMLLDTDIGIVSTATVDYTSLGTLLKDDPMTRPRDAIAMVDKKLPRNPAAVIGGLLALGDPRVCKLVRPLRHTLNAEQVMIVTKCFSGFVAKCTVDFYLDWLDELVDRRDYDGLGVFGNVAAGLYRLADGRKVPFVSDGLRPFPVPIGENVEWPGICSIDPVEFSASIAERLYDLEKREAPPKVTPHAIRAFGLVPRTIPENVALMQ